MKCGNAYLPHEYRTDAWERMTNPEAADYFARNHRHCELIGSHSACGPYVFALVEAGRADARASAPPADDWTDGEALQEAESILREVASCHAAGGGEYCSFHAPDVLRVTHWLAKRVAAALVSPAMPALRTPHPTNRDTCWHGVAMTGECSNCPGLSAPPAVPAVAEKREPKAGDTWLDTLDGREWTLLRRSTHAPHGWHTESRPGADNGFAVDGTWLIPGRLRFVRAAAPPPGEGREPKTCRFCKGVPRPGCAHCEGTGRDLCWKRCTVNKAPGYCKLDEGHDGKCGPRVCSATPGEETPK